MSRFRQDASDASAEELDITGQPFLAEPHLTFHAAVRMQQRRISEEDIDLVMRCGRLYYGRDAEIYILVGRDLRGHVSSDRISRLNGIHVICDRSGEVRTTYRNRRRLNRPRTHRGNHRRP
jgi:hypothetical protein